MWVTQWHLDCCMHTRDLPNGEAVGEGVALRQMPGVGAPACRQARVVFGDGCCRDGSLGQR